MNPINTTVKAAAVQMSPILYSREGTTEKVIAKIYELAEKGVQFATFPETLIPYYPYFSFVQPAYAIISGSEHLKLLDQSVTVPSTTTDAIGKACQETNMVVSIGVNERDGGTIYNTQLLFDSDGTLLPAFAPESDPKDDRVLSFFIEMGFPVKKADTNVE